MYFLKKIVYFLAVLFLFQTSYAQSKKYNKHEINQLLKKAGKNLLNLECKESLDIAKITLEESLKINDSVLIAKSYNLIALNIEEFSDYNKAIEYYQRGLKYALKSKNDTIISWLYSNIGNAYLYGLQQPKKSLKFYKKGLFYSKKTNDIYEISYSKLSLASAYVYNSEYKEAKKILDDVKNHFQENGDIESKISYHSLYGNYYNNIDDNKNAEYHFLESLKYSKENKTKLINSNIVHVYSDISNFYFKIKQYEKSIYFLKKKDSLQEKVYSVERKNEVKLASINIENDEINRRIKLIEAEKYIQDEKIQKNRQFIIFSVIIVFTLILLLLSFVRNNKLNSKINKELKLANAELLVAKEKAEESSQLKTQFISTISHELRTPLYSVIGITDIILDEHKELKDSSYLKSLKFSAKYLLSLVNDILNVCKIEENQVVLEDSVFNLEDELNLIKDSLHFLAIKNNNQIHLEIDHQIPDYLVGDKIRLSQIFINLISNSLKFTQNGYVTFKAILMNLENNNCQIKFQVIDNGIGIAKKDQEKVFEKFVQVYRKEDDYQGTGLGLTIVKKMVELFDGTIELQSEKDKGTTITIIINLNADSNKINEIVNNFDVDFYVKKNYTFLVVEDNKINQVVTKKLLEINNFQCAIVSDGYTALEILETKKFDVILMDINMPLINGFDTSKLIRQKGITIPIIAVTAFDKKDIEDKIIEAQIDDVIVKPLDRTKLFEVIRWL